MCSKTTTSHGHPSDNDTCTQHNHNSHTLPEPCAQCSCWAPLLAFKRPAIFVSSAVGSFILLLLRCQTWNNKVVWQKLLGFPGPDPSQSESKCTVKTAEVERSTVRSQALSQLRYGRMPPRTTRIPADVLPAPEAEWCSERRIKKTRPSRYRRGVLDGLITWALVQRIFLCAV